jgi:hypothetical protein
MRLTKCFTYVVPEKKIGRYHLDNQPDYYVFVAPAGIEPAFKV